MSGLAGAGTVQVTGARAAAVSVGGDGRARVTLRNLGPFGVRVGADESVSYAPTPSGFTLPPGTERSFELDGIGLFLIAPPCAGRVIAGGGVISVSTVDYVVESIDTGRADDDAPRPFY